MSGTLALPGIAGPGMKKAALLSPDGKHRYRLQRIWDADLPVVTWIMLNPSTADADVDDQTIRKCIGFSKRENFGGIDVVNLYSFRATSPRDLLLNLDHGTDLETDPEILKSVYLSEAVILGWGAFIDRDPRLPHRVGQVRQMLSAHAPTTPPQCLGRTKEGHPRHPCYLAYSTPLEAFCGA